MPCTNNGFCFQTWDTDDGDHVENQFDYYEETAASIGSDRDMSAKGQIVC